MTPAGWTLENVTLLGFAALFVGAITSVALGALVARSTSPTRGAGVGLMAWGLGNLLVAAWAVLLVHVDTRVLLLPPTRCEPLAPADGGPQRQQFHRLLPAGPTLREVSTPPAPGLCAEDASAEPVPLRVRLDAMASTRPVIDGELADPDHPVAVIVTWSVFGGVALLMGLALLLHRRAPSVHPRNRPLLVKAPVAPWRVSIGNLLGTLGLLVFLAAFIGPFVMDGSTERGLMFGFRAAATALGIWCVSGGIAGTLGAGGMVFMLVFAGILMGLVELVRFGA